MKQIELNFLKNLYGNILNSPPEIIFLFFFEELKVTFESSYGFYNTIAVLTYKGNY